MKILRIMRLGIILAFCIATAGCVGETVKFNTAPDQKYEVTKGQTVMSDACGFQLLLVIPIDINDRAQRAYEDLVRKAGRDYVVANIRVQERWYWAFVGTVYCTELEAMAYPKTVVSTGTVTQQ